MTIGLFLDKNKIIEYIDRNKMFRKGDAVVIGLSGGPDSVCLFFVCLALQKRYDLSIYAMHINHCIRGKDADEDQAFVEKLCKDYDVPCFCKRVDIPALVKLSGRSVEEEARMVRYEAFFRLAADIKKQSGRLVRIAVAHNANDNAETVLFHMARGTGLDGLCGIVPVRGDIVRPLLMVEKSEIVKFLDECGQDYCIDGTNSDTEYDRNRIRHRVLPELSLVNSQTLQHISEMTVKLQQVSDFINLEADGLLVMAKNENGSLRKRTIATAPDLIRATAMKRFLSKYMPDEKDVSGVHIDAILGLLTEDGEKYVDLPHMKRLVISYDEIFVQDKSSQSDEKKNGRFDINDFKVEEIGQIPGADYTKWFDYDKISGDIEIRTRQEGDYITINSSMGHKSIQDYFIDQKIPKSKRDEIWLVCDGHHVLWVVGYRISEYYKVTRDTTHVLEISYWEE